MVYGLLAQAKVCSMEGREVTSRIPAMPTATTLSSSDRRRASPLWYQEKAEAQVDLPKVVSGSYVYTET